MKRPTKWLFWLLLAKCLTRLVHGEFFILSGPDDYSGQFYYQNYRDMYCVTDELSSALTWNTNLDWYYGSYNNNAVNDPEVVYNDKYVYPQNDTLTCQMKHIESCMHNWMLIGSWNVTASLKNPTAPVFDNRWNGFATHKLKNSFEKMEHLASSGSLSVSVRGSVDAHFAICTGNISSSFCFFIILGGWRNMKSVIRKCENGIPDPTTNYPTGDCTKAINEKSAPVLSATEWKTFVIKWDFKTEVSLSVYSTHTKLLEFKEKLSNYYTQKLKSYFMSTNYNFYARSSSTMWVKFHFFQYLKSTTTQSKLISPPIMTASANRTMCLEMSIYLCDGCMLFVDYVDRNGISRPVDTFHNTAAKNHYDLPAWQTVKIRKKLPADALEPITLSINTFRGNNTYKNNTYWAVSNIQRCHDGALKVTKIEAYQDYLYNSDNSGNYIWPVVTCQKISPDGTSMIIDSTNRRNTSLSAAMRTLCPEGKIGPSCLTSCSKLFKNNGDCKKLLACDRYGCSCAQGFSLPDCDKECPESTFGFECTLKCGNCTDGSCNPFTGKCRYGCENNRNKFFILPYCKIGVGSPPAPTVDVINSTCAKIALEVIDSYKIIPTRVYFKIYTNASIHIPEIEQFVIKNDTYNLEFFAEHLNPGIHYNAVAMIYVEDRTFTGESTNFTTPCTESVSLNFVVEYNETSIILDNRVDVNVNDSCPYTWYRVQLINAKNKLFDDSTKFPAIFNNLESATLYRLIVLSEKNTIVNKPITTLDGAPTVVRNLKVLSSSENEIQISWRPPTKTNGKITNYTAEIRPIESMGCVDFNVPSQNLSNIRNSEEFKMHTTVLTNTSLHEYNMSFRKLHPYTKYLIVVYASTSRHTGEKDKIRHKTSYTNVPTEVFANLRLTNETSNVAVGYLRWDPPSDCSAITGPIKAAKLFIRKMDMNITSLEIRDYYYALSKYFNGTETYEVRVYPLRYVDSKENETAFSSLIFTMPDRAPPSVRNVEIVEVDTQNGMITYRWEAPLPPIHGKLKHFSITFCRSHVNSCDVQHFDTYLNEFCHLWDLENTYCKIVSFPLLDYDIVKIRAHNRNVTEASEPYIMPVLRTEIEPTAPTELLLDIIKKENATINVTWTHPLVTGGKLDKFLIQIKLINSNLKIQPFRESNITYDISTTHYQSKYSTELNLLPSSTFVISVKAVTWSGREGSLIERRIALSSQTNFSIEKLTPVINEDLTISIVIPEVMYDVKDSRMIIVVQGPKYCDEGPSNNEDIDLLLKTQSASYYKNAWKAATLMKPEQYANKEFRIGDGEVYGGSKNYALCSKESYIVYLVLIEDPETLQKEYRNVGRNILKTAKTNAIQIGELPTNYAMWLTPVFFVILIFIMIALILYRKKFSSHFLKDKSKSPQENMPLSNNFSKKKSSNLIEEVDSVIKVKEMPNNLFIVEKKMEFEKPVSVEEFGNYFESAYKSGQLGNEYMTIKDLPTKPCTYGSLAETKPKNRYANLFPYDDTRVILEKLPDAPYSDYINANYITGYGGKERTYIATQGPKPTTVIDFWRMVWQEKVQIICMMANLEENGKIKCEQYWPSAAGKKMLYGTVSVYFISEEIHSDYTYRTFHITSGNEETRTIEHLHYTVWPDHGVPSNPRSIVAFLNEIQRHVPCPRSRDDPPIIVHCSAGVGRTGTLIVLDMSICRAFSEQVIDVYEDVVSVRKERLNMVDNTEQYLLVHLVLVEYLNLKDTCFTCDKTLPQKIDQAKKNSMIQYKRIVDTSWWNEVLGSPPLPEKSLSNKNRAKHRFPESAAGYNRLYLKRSSITDEDSDYIAATCVKGLFKNCQCITTQLPLPSTAADFWRMLSEMNVEFVLVLQLPNLQDPSYCELVPENQGYGSTNYLKIIRQEKSTTDSQYYYKEEVLIIDSSEQPSKHQIVTIASYKNWPEASSSSSSSSSSLPLPPPRELVKLWKSLDKLAQNEQNPSVIACCDGVTACGLWLAVTFLLKKMKMDNECDVYQAVRAVRRIRKDFLNKAEYLDYLYDVALAWVNDD